MYTMLMSLLVLLGWVRHSYQHELYVPQLPTETYDMGGSLVLGVLMPVHLRSKDGKLCGEDISDMGLLQRIEAVAYAIQEVNADPHLLVNHTLGFAMYDDCFTDLAALGHSLHFARSSEMQTGFNWCVTRDECAKAVGTQGLRHVPVVGLLGSESSITTVEAAKMMSIFRIPHISYLASSPLLSNKVKYPGFRRMVPSDAVQVKAMVALLKHFEWTFVNVLYAQGEYGEEAFKVLVNETKDTNICFNMIREITHTMTLSDYRTLVRDIILDQSVNVSVVIVFVPSSQGRDILHAASGLPSAKGRITWIASSSWVNHIEELDTNIQEEAVGMLSLSFDSMNVLRFDKHFQNISVGNAATLNPWLEQYWQTYHNCSVSSIDSPSVCNDQLLMADHPSYSPDKFTSLVFDSIYTFAYALDELLNGPCFAVSDTDLYPCIDMYLNDQLTKTNFIGNDGNPVSFDASGNRIPTRYLIHNVQNVGANRYELVNIAAYVGSNDSLIFTGHDIQWTSGSEKPLSVCSMACSSDEGTVYQQKRCCWDCQKCRDDEVLKRFGQSPDIWICVKCSNNTWPNSTNRTYCVDIVPQWLSIADPLGTAMAVIATVGVTCCVLVLLVFILNNDHVLVKASSRELMFFMLGGLIISYFFACAFLIKPTQQVCIMKMIGVSVSFTLIYSPLSIKTIRIYRIFESGKKMNRKLRFINYRSQLMMATAIVFLHGLMLFVWLTLDPPSVMTVTPTPGYQEIICNFPLEPFAASFIFNAMLLVICAFFAFLTRKLPDNFNESRFIAFCVYSTLIVWLSVLPAYITASTSTLRVSLLCAIIILNAYVPLLLIFCPKVYAIYCMPTETLNVRRVTHSQSNSRCPDCVDMVAPDLVSSSSVGGNCYASRTSTTKRITFTEPSAVSSALNQVVPIVQATLVDSVISEKDELEPDVDKWM